MDWARITGYVGLLCIVISVLAQILAAIIPDYRELEEFEETLRWSRYLWTYAILIMAIFLYTKTRRISELLWGGIAGSLCLFPAITPFVSLVYAFRAFWQLSKLKDILPF